MDGRGPIGDARMLGCTEMYGFPSLVSSTWLDLWTLFAGKQAGENPNWTRGGALATAKWRVPSPLGSDLGVR